MVKVIQEQQLQLHEYKESNTVLQTETMQIISENKLLKQDLENLKRMVKTLQNQMERKLGN